MELTPLLYFVTVAHELHFRRAAAKLNMTQAPLSAAIKKLEDELETKLFERTSRSVKLTAAGEFFLPEAEAVLRRAELARQRLDKMVSGDSGKLAIGYNEPALNTFLPMLLARCRKYLPDIQLELRELETAEQLQRLRENVIDIGFMRPTGFDLGGLSSRLIHREKYVLVMQTNHPLAGCPKINIQQLSGKNLILFARDVNPFIYDRITAALSAGDLPPPRFRQDARNKSSMLALVKAGFGAALLPESSMNDGHPGLLSRSVELPLPDVDIHAVWDPEKFPPPLRQILGFLQEKV